jgi:hypothetical protein
LPRVPPGYKGPQDTTGGTPADPATPATPGVPDAPYPPGRATTPTTPALPDASGLPRHAVTPVKFETAPASWQLWWYLNRDTYLRRYLDSPSVSFTDGPAAIDASARLSHKNAPTDNSTTLNALIDALHTGNAAVAPAALEALARCQAEVPAEYWQQQLQARTSLSSQAILSLGLSRSPQALELLFDILKDGGAGRKALSKNRISNRLRIEAAFALGAFGAQRGREMLNGMIADRMTEFLLFSVNAAPDLQRAAALSLAMMRPNHPQAVAEKLMRLMDEKSRPLDLQLQLPVAIAKLLEKTPSENSVKQEVLLRCWHLYQNKRTEAAMRLSAIQAIGLLADAEGPHGASMVDELKKTYGNDRNRNLRNHSLMALAYIGGRVGPEAPIVEKEVLPFLLKIVRKGNKEAQAWAALSIGVMGANARELGFSQFTAPVGMALLDAFANEKSPSNRAALALSLALMEYRTASETLHTALHDTHQVDLLSYLCTSLGMLGETTCRGDFLDLISKGNVQVQLVHASSEALAMLGGTGSVDQLIPILLGENGNSMQAQAAAAFALRNFPEKKAEEALTKVLLNPDSSVWVARECCATLGVFGSDVQEMLRSRFASDLNTWALPADLEGPEGILERL